MPWCDLPDPVPPMTSGERLQAIVARQGCLGITGLIVLAAIVASFGADWWGRLSAVAR